MKKSIFIVTLLISLTSIGQKRLSAITYTEYSESGVKNNVDSSSYSYVSQGYGGFDSLIPLFSFDGGVFSYLLNRPLVNCDIEKKYQGTSYPLALAKTLNNSMVNNSVSESNNANIYRILYEYNSSGKITSRVNQTKNLSVWETTDSVYYSYDTLNNVLSKASFILTSGLNLVTTDSMIYEQNSSRMTSYKRYILNGTMSLTNQTLISYSGDSIQYLDLYQDDGSGNLDWILRLNYSYAGMRAIGFVAYGVSNNIPSSSVLINGTYAFNGLNLNSSNTIIMFGDTLEQVNFTYHPDGFIASEKRYYPNSNGIMYLSEKLDYYYASEAGVDEIQLVDVLIYPNPTSDFVILKGDDPFVGIQLINQNGQIILTQTSNKIDMHHLSKGTYYIKVQTEKGIFTQKIVKN